MKKFLCILLCVLLPISAMLGCGGEIIEKIDKNKTQLYIDYYTGGLGNNWLKQAKKDYEAENPKIQVVITDSDKSSGMQVQDMKTSKPTAQIYYGVDTIYHEAINLGAAEDLSDLLPRKPDGEDGLTIEEKILDMSLWSRIGKKKDNPDGFYMLPNSDSLFGQVFDYDTFVENGWLAFAQNDANTTAALTAQGITFEVEPITEHLIFKSSTGEANYIDGEVITACGKDKKYGTYDDGQPQTLQEYYTMLNTIKNAGWKSYVWTTKFSPFYSQPVSAATLFQLLGEEGLKTYKTYNGSFVDTRGTFGPVGETVTITPETGYKVFQMPEVYKAIEIAKNTYMNPAYVNADSFNTDTSHTSAQTKLLLSYKKDDPEDGKFITPTAMLFEGSWWENEARPTFQKIVEEGKPERGFGKRDYRYMFMPTIDGQKGTKSYIVGSGTSGMVVSSKQSPELMKITKDFIVYTLQDKYLKMAQLDSGVPKPYKTNMTKEDYAKLTPFGRSLSELVNDSENVRVFRTSAEYYTEPLNFLSGRADTGDFCTTVTGENAGTYYALDIGLQRVSVDEFFNGISNFYKADDWKVYYEKVKDYYVK